MKPCHVCGCFWWCDEFCSANAQPLGGIRRSLARFLRWVRYRTCELCKGTKRDPFKGRSDGGIYMCRGCLGRGRVPRGRATSGESTRP